MSAVERINGEPVKLVESFNELREGMVVWVKPCPVCASSHRGMLFGENRDAALAMDGLRKEPAGSRTIQVIPRPPCVTLTPNACIREDRFKVGSLYRVVDEQRESKTVSHARELERVR